MATTTETTIRLTRVINADPATVFEAWTSPEHLKNWSAPEGMSVGIAEVDLRIGGRFRIRMENPDGEHFTAVGTYLEIDAPRKLRYTWKWEEQGINHYDTEITVEFMDRDGATEVIMIHDLFPDAEEAAKHDHGWTSCLNRLEGLFAD